MAHTIKNIFNGIKRCARVEHHSCLSPQTLDLQTTTPSNQPLIQHPMHTSQTDFHWHFKRKKGKWSPPHFDACCSWVCSLLNDSQASMEPFHHIAPQTDWLGYITVHPKITTCHGCACLVYCPVQMDCSCILTVNWDNISTSLDEIRHTLLRLNNHLWTHHNIGD